MRRNWICVGSQFADFLSDRFPGFPPPGFPCNKIRRFSTRIVPIFLNEFKQAKRCGISKPYIVMYFPSILYYSPYTPFSQFPPAFRHLPNSHSISSSTPFLNVLHLLPFPQLSFFFPQAPHLCHSSSWASSTPFLKLFILCHSFSWASSTLFPQALHHMPFPQLSFFYSIPSSPSSYAIPTANVLLLHSLKLFILCHSPNWASYAIPPAEHLLHSF